MFAWLLAATLVTGVVCVSAGACLLKQPWHDHRYAGPLFLSCCILCPLFGLTSFATLVVEAIKV